MQVNITLLVQMCNFFVAWFLLHIFYFKPAIAVLDQQQKEKDDILLRKSAWHEYIEAKQHEIQTYWRKLKHFVRRHMPESAVEGYSARLEAIELSKADNLLENPLDSAAHAKLVLELTEKITKRVPHVDL